MKQVSSQNMNQKNILLFRVENLINTNQLNQVNTINTILPNILNIKPINMINMSQQPSIKSPNILQLHINMNKLRKVKVNLLLQSIFRVSLMLQV